MTRLKRVKMAALIVTVVFGFTVLVSSFQQAPDMEDFETENGVAAAELVYVDPSTVNAKDLYTFTCEATEQKPEDLIESCGDGGVLVHSIKWSSWGAIGARGVGTFSANQCDPSCAEGSRLETPVHVSLTDVIKWKGKFYLVNLEVTPVNPAKVPAELNPHGWDVSEFARVMDW